MRPRARRLLSGIGGAAKRRATDLVDRLLPPACAVCRSTVPPGPPLCGICESLLPLIPHPRCRRCGAPSTSIHDGARCGVCDAWPEPLHSAASAVLHAPPADDLVAGLKYRGWTALAPRLAGFMVEPARRLVRRADLGEAAGHLVLVPVPLDPGRLRKRGFNQAGLLAAGIAAATGWSVLPAGLRRRRGRRRQAELGRSERLANVGSAFGWEPGVGVPGAPMLLVDDVLTTGATAAACTAAIEGVGGTCIGVVTFARSLPRVEGA